jgi:hypothetical protein
MDNGSSSTGCALTLSAASRDGSLSEVTASDAGWLARLALLGTKDGRRLAAQMSSSLSKADAGTHWPHGDDCESELRRWQRHESPRIASIPGAFGWLRGLDLNQRPLGYEIEAAMTGHPLISREVVQQRRVERFMLVCRPSCCLALFRGLMGAKSEQPLRSVTPAAPYYAPRRRRRVAHFLRDSNPRARPTASRLALKLVAEKRRDDIETAV